MKIKVNSQDNLTLKVEIRSNPEEKNDNRNAIIKANTGKLNSISNSIKKKNSEKALKPAKKKQVLGSKIHRDRIYIGILATKYFPSNSFGVQDMYFREFLGTIASYNGIGYIFSAADIIWEKNIVLGYKLNANGEWIIDVFPLPTVCYNRSFAPPSLVWAKDTVTRLSRKGVIVFNSSIGDKWSVYKKIAKYTDVADFQPESRLLLGHADLELMLNKHKMVYIKPINGTKGKGIIKISRKKNRYELHRAEKSGVEIYNSTKSLKIGWQKGDYPRAYLIQQGIEVYGDGAHFDLRVIVQKDAENAWQVSGIAARLGLDGQITTNIHTGGQANEFEQVFADRGCKGEDIYAIKGEICRLSLRIAEILSKTALRLGELGLDFIVDKSNKVWFLEANRKPGRQCFEAMDEESRIIALQRPIEYAFYLARRKLESKFQLS